jgi:hypothetical protein
MRQSKVLAQQAINRPQRMEQFRRRAWAPRRVRRPSPVEISEPPSARNYIPGEFYEEPRFPTLFALQRCVRLTWDVSLLAALSPFFAGWFLYRSVMVLTRTLR